MVEVTGLVVEMAPLMKKMVSRLTSTLEPASLGTSDWVAAFEPRWVVVEVVPSESLVPFDPSSMMVPAVVLSMH